MKQIQATATIQLTIEVKAYGCWGGDSAIDQLYKQAATSARERVHALIKSSAPAWIRVIGEPKVTGIITEDV